jgi:hypothetical protein
MAGFWSRATLALALAVYGWSMLGVELYLKAAPVPEGPDRGLALFRREIMGRAVVGVGSAAVLAAAVLAALALARPDRRGLALGTLALVAGFAACVVAIWPV